MILYNLKTDKGAAAYGTEQYTITKFNDDLNVESSYLVTRTGCLCPQGHKDTCRHRKMLPLMIDRADSSWFYCFDDKQWYDPTGMALIEETNAVMEDMPYVESGAPAPDLSNEDDIDIIRVYDPTIPVVDRMEAHSSTAEQGPLKAEVEGSSPSEPAKLRRLR